MYGIDLTDLTLDDFVDIIANMDLLPSRRMLADDLPAVMARFQQQGTETLADLSAILSNKKRYPELTERLAVSTDYLTILNREVNSYKTKPVPLAKLNLFTEEELERLKDAGIKTSKHLYERGLTPDARQALATDTGMPLTQIETALQRIDLVRINGVGPVFAEMLHTMAMTSATDFLEADSGELLRRYKAIGAASEKPQAPLGLKDIAYCKRFARLLDHDLVW